MGEEKRRGFHEDFSVSLFLSICMDIYKLNWGDFKREWIEMGGKVC